MIVVKLIVIFLIFNTPVHADITSVSSIKACLNDGSGEILRQRNGTACRRQLVVAMTVQADEGRAQSIEVNVQTIHDSTTNQNLELKRPVRVRVIKSPVIINYRLYQVGYVNALPYEEVVKGGRKCRDDWFAKNSQVPCRFQYTSSGDRIFDSQGFCCRCRTNKAGYDRGESLNCLRSSNTAHCLRFDRLNFYVFGLYPPSLQFNISVKVDQVLLRDRNESIYEQVESLSLGPFNRTAISSNFRIRAAYIADFHTSTFMPVLAHKFLLIPDLENFASTESTESANAENITQFHDAVKNVSEWLLVDKHLFDFTGFHCNKIGVSYPAFQNQADRCTRLISSCLQSQPYDLWKEDTDAEKQNQRLQYKLHSFGKVHSAPHSDGSTNFQMNFLANEVQRSLITLAMEADGLRSVINKSPGRITQAYIDPFESLSIEGVLSVYVQNTGEITATYTVSVGHCSGGIDWIPSKSATIDPGQESELTFSVSSFQAIGQINTCEVELLDQTGEILDKWTVQFETQDTCFCYGYCGCSCGNNISDCPPQPNYHNSDTFRDFRLNLDLDLGLNLDIPDWISDITDLFDLSFLGPLFIGVYILGGLITLGVLKVVLMVYTGNVSCPGFDAFLYGMSQIFDFCFESFCIICNCCCDGVVISKKFKKMEGKGNCDGTCPGLKQAKRAYKKKLNFLKRKGDEKSIKKAKLEWKLSKPKCTCVDTRNTQNTKNILEIFKGLFFFFYCPILPFWWCLELGYEWCIRRRRRSKRKKEFRARKEAKKKDKANTYLQLDKYTRGTKKKKVVDFKEEKHKARLKKKLNDLKALEEGRFQRFSSEDSQSSDSSEAFDLDELLDPGYPVFMNYNPATKKKRLRSLKNPGKSFSIKGRLIAQTTSTKTIYIFDLYKYTKQVIVENNIKLKPPNKLKSEEFKKNLLLSEVKQLITVTPLFTCLNK